MNPMYLPALRRMLRHITYWTAVLRMANNNTDE